MVNIPSLKLNTANLQKYDDAKYDCKKYDDAKYFQQYVQDTNLFPKFLGYYQDEQDKCFVSEYWERLGPTLKTALYEISKKKVLHFLFDRLAEHTYTLIKTIAEKDLEHHDVHTGNICLIYPCRADVLACILNSSTTPLLKFIDVSDVTACNSTPKKISDEQFENKYILGDKKYECVPSGLERSRSAVISFCSDPQKKVEEPIVERYIDVSKATSERECKYKNKNERILSAAIDLIFRSQSEINYNYSKYVTTFLSYVIADVNSHQQSQELSKELEEELELLFNEKAAANLMKKNNDYLANEFDQMKSRIYQLVKNEKELVKNEKE